MKKLVLLVAVGLMLTVGGFAYAAPTVDVVQTPTNYFVPTDGQKTNDPYYRYYNEDWGWSHNAIAGSFTSASLNISAYDVDWSNSSGGEWDIIRAKNNSGTWVELGHLDGNNNIWAYTIFALDLANFGLAINSGLEVEIDIDSTHNSNFWAVTLAKSTLSLDGGQGPGPEPGPVPEPLTMLLLGLGLTGIAGARRFTK